MNDDLQVDKTGFSINCDWATAKRIFAWVRTTIITLGLGAGGWSHYTTRNTLADVEARLAKCEKRLEAQERAVVPGPNPGTAASGPPPVIAPDFTRKVDQ